MMTQQSVFPLILCATSVALVFAMTRLRKDEKETRAHLAELRQKRDSLTDENKEITDEILLYRMEIELWEKAKKKINGRKLPGFLISAGILFFTTSCGGETDTAGICASASLSLILLGCVVGKAYFMAGLVKEILRMKEEIARLEESNSKLKQERAEMKAQKIRSGGEMDAFIDAATSRETRNDDEVSEFQKNVTRIMRSHIGDTDFGIDDLVKELGMSRSSFFNRWRKENEESANVVLHDMRLKEAWDQLKEGRKNVSEIGFELGYNSLSYFSRCFKAKYGISPSKVRN